MKQNKMKETTQTSGIRLLFHLALDECASIFVFRDKWDISLKFSVFSYTNFKTFFWLPPRVEYFLVFVHFQDICILNCFCTNFLNLCFLKLLAWIITKLYSVSNDLRCRLVASNWHILISNLTLNGMNNWTKSIHYLYQKWGQHQNK